MPQLTELHGDIWQLDLEECGFPGRTAGYLIKGDSGWMLIETGPASSADQVFRAVETLGINSHQLKYIAATHIHLDHAGGMGVLARHFRQAGIVIHHRGARHLVDPSRLAAAAMSVWGPDKMQQYGAILPVDRERVIMAGEGLRLDLGNRVIEVWETPGHAHHHLCFYDVNTKGLFSGDAAGMYLPNLVKLFDQAFLWPLTPVHDYHACLMMGTLTRLALSDLEYVYFTHFGPAARPRSMIEQLLGRLTILMHLARETSGDLPGGLATLIQSVNQFLKKGLAGKGDCLLMAGGPTRDDWNFLMSQVQMNCEGLLGYLEQRVIEGAAADTGDSSKTDLQENKGG